VTVLAERRLTALAIASDLRSLGLEYGATVLVHCAMRRLGRIENGSYALLAALRHVLGPEGTIVVPTQTANNSLTSPPYRAATAGLTGAERARYEREMPGFDAHTTPSYGMGALAERVRQSPGALRSSHPQTSFAALGPAAADLVRVHELGCHLGERSPLGALYRAGASILLLGVGMDKCTALHLAEYRLDPSVPIMKYSCFVTENGQRRRRDFEAPALDDSDFPAAGADLLRQSWASSGRVGRAEAYLLPLVDAVDRAKKWFTTNRHRS
jgi:aminoglycoside 3-N-acetyltransferase